VRNLRDGQIVDNNKKLRISKSGKNNARTYYNVEYLL